MQNFPVKQQRHPSFLLLKVLGKASASTSNSKAEIDLKLDKKNSKNLFSKHWLKFKVSPQRIENELVQALLKAIAS